jgi:hypothetical protein
MSDVLPDESRLAAEIDRLKAAFRGLGSNGTGKSVKLGELA